jgi:chorismate mutase
LAWGLAAWVAIGPLTGLAETPCAEPTVCRLEALRGRIDAIDADLVQTIADRLAVAREIGAVKRAAGLPVVNVEREAVVIAGFVEKARARGISEETARAVIQSLIAAARAEQ